MKILVLGAGISGLSVAWFLKRRFGDALSISVVEAADRTGGWIRSLRLEGSLFEAGPRGYRPHDGAETSELLEQLGITREVIQSDESSSGRYLFFDQALRPLPRGLGSFIHSSALRLACLRAWQEFTGKTSSSAWESGLRRFLGDGVVDVLVAPRTLAALMWIGLREFRTPAGQEKDESIQSFFERRLGKAFTDLFINALVSGLFVGDSSLLSMPACFPDWFDWERRHGSLLKGWWASRKGSRRSSSPRPKGLCSFKGGFETLVAALSARLDVELQSPVLSLRFEKQGVVVELPGRTLRADGVISALPAHRLAPLLAPWCLEASQLLHSIPYSSVGVVGCHYRRPVLRQVGHGYLVPPGEKEAVLGGIWDSHLFPQNYEGVGEALTLMVGGDALDEGTCRSVAHQALASHLNLAQEPDACAVALALDSLPQYTLGHAERLARLESLASELFPRFAMVGAYTDGMSVNACIRAAKKKAELFL